MHGDRPNRVGEQGKLHLARYWCVGASGSKSPSARVRGEVVGWRGTKSTFTAVRFGRGEGRVGVGGKGKEKNSKQLGFVALLPWVGKQAL